MNESPSTGFIQPDWPCPPGVHALATTTRVPGTNETGFNLATHVNDAPDRVRHHRDLLHAHAGLPSSPLWLNQVHGCDVVDAEHSQNTPTADASFTVLPGQVLAVLTADCLPILIAAEDGSAVAAVHAGWRGLAAGVIEAAVARFAVQGTGPTELVTWLGAAIGPVAYEVDAPVRDAVLNRLPADAQCFKPSRPGHWLFNLSAAAHAVLNAVGVSRVYGGTLCTYTDERFFSFRRDSSCGRQATLIWRQGNA